MVDGVSHKSALSHPQLVINRIPGAQPKTRHLHIVQGISGENRKMKINNPDIDTLATALLERVFYHERNGGYEEPHQPSLRHVFKTLRQFRGKLLGIVGKATPVSPDEFAQMYKGRKATIYQAAAMEYMTVGVRRSDACSDAFVKCEKVPYNKAPRCIQPRRVVYNVGVGKYLRPYEHKLYQSVQHVFGSATPVIMKGFNCVSTAEILVAKFSSFNRPVAIGLDASRFDQHVSAAMLKWEHSIYNAMFGSEELAQLLGWQISNRGRGFCDDGFLRYKCLGRRFSGDMNTALGNCLIMCGMIYAYAKERDVAIDLANNGDDCVVFMEAEDEQRFSEGLDEWFANLGFVMTVEKPVYRQEDIEFCQMRPLSLGGGKVVMCRDFIKAREKDSMIINGVQNEMAYRKWLRAVGECGLAIASGVPIFQSYYSLYNRFGVSSKMKDSVQFQSGFLHLSKGLHPRVRPVTEEARESFYLAFGVTPDEQIALEEYYDTLDLSGYETVYIEGLDEVVTAPF